MEIRRTVPVKLDVDDHADTLLQETFKQFKKACQHVADVGWHAEDYIIDNKTELHERTYDSLREATDLQASHVQLARNLAADALKGCVKKLENDEKASKPTFTSDVVVHNQRTMTFKDGGVSLATVDDRIHADFILPHEDDNDNPQTEYLSEDWEKREATLHHRDGDYYLHVTVRKEVEDKESEDAENGTSRSGSFDGSQIEDLRTVLGVDLNVTGGFAVTSTGYFVESADYINHVRNEYEKRRGGMQEKGTRSAHLTMKSVGSRFARWSEQKLHETANEIVEEAVEHSCMVIAFEDLEGIRENISNDKKFQQWAFNRLYEYVEYKAEERGIDVEQVNPEYTSRRCSKCGFTHEKNRDGDDFECLKCGYELNADYNASKNIAMKYLRREQKSHGGGATSHLALKSGVLNVNGQYRPAELLG
ncbi:MAG: transposase [Halobacteria archaeon]|nr:transposase [Halobacteria archaeon]